jgi:hypothetical protein
VQFIRYFGRVKNLLIILIVLLIGSNGFGQESNEVQTFDDVKRHWFNPKNKSYIEIKNDSLLLTLKMFKNWTTDTVGQYEVNAYQLNWKNGEVILTSNWYLTTGIRFWRLRDRCTYQLKLSEDKTTLVLNMVKMNHKNMNTIAILLGKKDVKYIRTTEEDYKTTNAIRYD